LNDLLHLYLSDQSPSCLLGSLMGDYVKGRLDDSYPPDLQQGIRLHRRIDVFAQSNEHFRRSKGRLDPSFGYCRGIMVDIFYDHLLARYWRHYSPIPLEEFAERICMLLTEQAHLLPPGLRLVAPRMISSNWLVSYQNPEMADRILRRLSARLRRPNRLGEGGAELVRNFAGLREDFDGFLADAVRYVGEMAGPEGCGRPL
jgi:acyl carrier protein phosphodiesterase